MMVALAVLFGMFYLLALLRLAKRRMNPRYLRRVSIRTFAHLTVWLAIFSAAWHIVNSRFYPWFSLLQLIVAAILLGIVAKTLYKMRTQPVAASYADGDLPTVSVAIPARNETRALEECLRSFLASDYPKLEIIVLDDCSGPKTAEVIRGFAQAGVRFIPGTEPSKRWLAKNQAYETLYREASGEIVLFCGVDVRVGPHTVRQLVYLMKERNKRMLSVLPHRIHSKFSDGLIQPMRYWWEVALPRKLLNRPAVLSTCWMIYRQDMHNMGGFKAVSRSITPEQYFARQLVKQDGYTFVGSSEQVEVRTTKLLRDQLRTALRLRYPQVRRRPELVLLLLMFEFAFLFLPFIQWIYFLLTGQAEWTTSFAACVCLIVAHMLLLRATDPANSLLAGILFPFAVLTEMMLVIASMLQYEFFTVTWKNRNICIPVMHVVPSLPGLSPTKKH